ncbi:hypothetical protein GX51_04769 [Blastomyces parvus]|uniref:Uncharacterized protein n=1 Tax=Blastomyces parvus TaxID=2060905 RepID=A0A2B7WZT8_9EURO|nr:hypothetical protein GX51_04769 [Blastomyces parvus]
MAPPHIIFGGGGPGYSSSDDDSFVVRSHSRVRRHSRPRVDTLEVPRRGRPRASSVGPQGRDANIFIVNEARSPSRERSHSHVRARPRLFAEEDALVDLDEQMEQLRRHRRPRSRSAHSPHPDIEEHLRLERLKILERREETLLEERNRKLDEQIQELQKEREKRIRERERELERERDRERDRDRDRHRDRNGDRDRSRDRDRGRDRPSRDKELALSRRDIEYELQIEKLLQMQHDLEAQKFIDDQVLVRRAQAKEEEEAEKEQEKRIREKIEAERAKQEAEEAERKAYEAKLRKQAIDDYNRIEAEKKQKEKKEKEKADKEFEERARATLAKSGYSDEQITAILKGEKEKPKAITQAPAKPTFIKVSSQHISPDTLDAYNIPWEWDDRDREFILIKRWVTDDEQEELFEHTKMLRQGQRLLIAPAPSPQPPVGVRLRDRDEMYLVRTRKKSPRRPSGWGLW